MQINTFCIRSSKLLQRTTPLLAALLLGFGGVSAVASPVFDQPELEFKGSVSSQGIVLPGGEAQLQGRGFRPGQEIQLLRSGTSIVDNDTIKADEKGDFKQSASIPADAVTGLHPIVVQTVNPSSASVFELKISPDLAHMGAEQFETHSAPITRGLYQSAYSPKHNRLYLSSSVGRPPVTQSEILKVVPTDLSIEARVTPSLDSKRDDGQVQAVYGIAVDDANDTIWVTNTRTNTVAVYQQDDLSLVKQFEHGAVTHARDVIIDSKANRAYASPVGTGEIAVFDTQTLEPLPSIQLRSAGRETPSPMSLALDSDNAKLYTVSINTNEAFVIDLKKQEQEQVITLPLARGASGVAVAPKKNVLFVASQRSDNVLLVDLKTGKTLHNVSVGAGPLNVIWDQSTQHAYVASRASGDIAVINLKGELVANLQAGKQPNHLSTDGKGNLYLVHKALNAEPSTDDLLTHIQRK